MTLANARVSNVAYSLGEIKGAYADASGFESVVKKESMMKIPQMWGWGNYFATADVLSLVQPTVKRTFDGAKIAPEDVDLVLFCAAVMPTKGSELDVRTAQILNTMGIDKANLSGVTMGGCATTLNAVVMANNLVGANVCRNVLVVGIDSLPVDLPRFVNYGIFSDACVSLLVSSEVRDGFEIVSNSCKTATAQILSGTDWQSAGLIKESVIETIDKAAIRISDIKRVFSNNTFLPIKTLKERNIGFANNQMYLGNVAEIGHCFSCDSVINYCVDRASRSEIDDGYFLLLADSDGRSCSVLIKEMTA